MAAAFPLSDMTSVSSPILTAGAAAAPQIHGLVILALCVLAGLGTVFLLPSRREMATRKIGGALLVIAGLVFLLLLVRFSAGRAETAGGQLGPYFWIFSSIALAGAFRVVTHPRPVYSALYFVMTVMASAGLFVLLQADFMAAALIIIYAGAILITYVFVIMLAAQTVASDRPLAGVVEYDAVSREPLVASILGFTLAGLLLFVLFDRAPAPPAAPAASVHGTAADLGAYLFTHQVASLEIAGVILTLCMVGAIIIARRRVVGGIVTENLPEEHVEGPSTPLDDNPHSIPVYGTENPAAKAYPET
jgi:NADH-quinone oxidoreductase subunit J